MAASGLTIENVNQLALDPSTATRVSTATALAHQFNTRDLKPAEIKLAHEIFRLLVKDAEIRVREALSASLKDNPNIPPDVALKLAQDVDAVALPMLSASEVLTAADLVQIVNANSSEAKMATIAGRKTVHDSVSAALVERGTELVLARLFANPGATVSEASFHRAVDRFGQSEIVLEPLVRRAVLPVTVSERLITHVADHLRTHLLSKHQISTDIAIDLVLQTRERATVGLAMGVGDDGLAALVTQLKDSGRLTTSLVLRAICIGNLRFFEHALAAMASVPIVNARLLIHESSGAGLRALWTKAGLSEAVFPAIHAALDTVNKTGFGGPHVTAEDYARQIIERVLTQYEAIGVAIDGDDLEYLLGRLNQHTYSAQRTLH